MPFLDTTAKPLLSLALPVVPAFSAVWQSLAAALARARRLILAWGPNSSERVVGIPVPLQPVAPSREVSAKLGLLSGAKFEPPRTRRSFSLPPVYFNIRGENVTNRSSLFRMIL